MRIPVRHQLSLLLILSSAIGLATLAIATWFVQHSFVVNVAKDGLETGASLKARDVATTLDQMYTSCLYLTTYGLVQQALKRYNNGSDTSPQNWSGAAEDMAAGMNSVGILRHTPAVQSQLFARNMTLGHQSVLNTTGKGNFDIRLPFQSTNGHPSYLGRGPLGFPPQLYPNLTVSKGNTSIGSYYATYRDQSLGLDSNLVLGPLTVNDSLSLFSMTVPVVDNYSETNILGWLTVVQSTRLLDEVVDDRTGLGKTGLTLLIGPNINTNQFGPSQTLASTERLVRFVLPVRPSKTSNCPSCTLNTSIFSPSEYPAIDDAIADGFHGREVHGTLLRTHNEVGDSVAVAYATPPTTLVNWVVIVEQSAGEFWAPVDHLRTIILACLFSVLGFFFFASLPIAHFAVRPITRLRAATVATIDPLYHSSSGSVGSVNGNQEEGVQTTDFATDPEKGFFGRLRRWRRNDQTDEPTNRRQRRFRIPSKVDTSKHWLKDDLLDLMETFNDMSDELFMQYSRLEERVQRRTVELEQSKHAAEAANESKTLFVANVSHELKTPLNGILGMCATSIETDDCDQIKSSLSIIYKSGDLLLRTLNDLLTFSTNQGNRELMLEEREFTFQDLETQILTIFEKQATEKGIILQFRCEEITPGLKDATLWGDVHRILQIMINLVSNSLKYTTEGGSITVAVRRSPDLAPRRSSRMLEQCSVQSQATRSTARSRRSLQRGTANFINPVEANLLGEKVVAPPGNDFYIEFDVTDTGQGIPEEMQARIFEPFVQGEAGLNRRHSGTGLGLSICSQLATLMRGSINLRSTLGVGSTFTVKLPLRQIVVTPSRRSVDPSFEVGRSSLRSISSDPRKSDDKVSEKDDDSRIDQPRPKVPVPAPGKVEGLTHAATISGPVLGNDASNDEPFTLQPSKTLPGQKPKTTPKSAKDGKPANEHDFSKLRVLVAEDNKVNQQVILRMLKMEQILQVTIAEDGQQALDHVTTPKDEETSDQPSPPPYDLIFMDIQMPVMDGLTSTRLIRESSFLGPIVALTAYAEKNNIADCYEAGVNHFLAKPLKKPQLHDVLIRLCSQAGTT